MSESTPASFRVLPNLISPGSGVLPGRSAFSVSRHVRHGEARGERRGLAKLGGRRIRSVTTHCFAGVDAVPAVARPAPTGRFSLAPRVRCGAGRSSGSRSPGTGVVAVTVAALTRRTVRAGPCPPLAGSPPAPWAWHSRRWSDIMPGRRCLSHPSAAVVSAARLMLQGANSHRGTELPARPAVGSGSDEPGRPDRRNLGCPAWALSVGGSDDSSEAFSGGGEFVFELFGAALGGFGLGGACVAFGEELAVRGF